MLSFIAQPIVKGVIVLLALIVQNCFLLAAVRGRRPLSRAA